MMSPIWVGLTVTCWRARQRSFRRAEPVLLKIYAHCINGQAAAANQRITDALGSKDTESEPGDGEDGEGEMAS